MAAKVFRVASRARASVLIKEGQSLSVNYRLDDRPIRLTFRTRFLNRGYTVSVPGNLWLDAEGEAESIETAAAAFTNAGRVISAAIALITNAAIAPLEPEIVYEISPGLAERPFLQRFMPADEIALTSRFVDVNLLGSIMERLAAHPDRERIIRSASQYSEALERWGMGNELPTLAHLFMGVEAITPARLRREMDVQQKTAEELGTEWGYDPNRRMSLKSFLIEVTRAKLIFADDPVFKVAKDVSDWFEHGTKNAGALYMPARKALVETAKYLRDAILHTIALPEDTLQAVARGNYARPRGHSGMENYWRSTLVGDAADLAASGEAYPNFKWEIGYKNVTFNADTALYEFHPDYKMTASIAPGLEFRGGALEVWDAGYFMPSRDEDNP